MVIFWFEGRFSLLLDFIPEAEKQLAIFC